MALASIPVWPLVAILKTIPNHLWYYAEKVGESNFFHQPGSPSVVHRGHIPKIAVVLLTRGDNLSHSPNAVRVVTPIVTNSHIAG